MRTFFTASALALLAGCAAPTVNLSTDQPIKVDISMRLDVYDHNKQVGTKSAAASPAAVPEARRRNRMFVRAIERGDERDARQGCLKR